MFDECQKKMTFNNSFRWSYNLETIIKRCFLLFYKDCAMKTKGHHKTDIDIEASLKKKLNVI